MPVDKQALEAAIQEAAAGDQEIAGLLRDKFAANEAAATAFVGGFMRTSDYTRKTQGVADEKKKLETQLKTYQEQLSAADDEKSKILKDLANQRVTVAGANARLQSLKDKYQLDDEDVPPMGDLIKTRKTGEVHDSTPDLDERFEAFKKDVIKQVSDTLVPELAGMTNLDIIWADMRDEHRELTGKRLTAAEQQDILKTARESGRSLMSVWEEKHGVQDLRKKVERDTWAKEERAKWEAEAAAKRSEEAMQGIRPGSDDSGIRTSPVLRKEFKTFDDPVDTKPGEKVRTMPSAETREGLTGAERAAKRFLERRAAGIPMGGKEVKSA